MYTKVKKTLYFAVLVAILIVFTGCSARFYSNSKLQSDMNKLATNRVAIPYCKSASSACLHCGVVCLPVYIQNNPKASNPTWRELVDFLDKDKTEKICYCSKFKCDSYAVTLHDNAEESGIKSAIVVIRIAHEEQLHALNAFMTTDAGLVYIDCTGDETGTGIDTIAYIEVGKNIELEELHRSVTLSANDVVTAIEIYW